MPESPRQEIEFKFNGKTYKRRPTWAALVNIEAATNQPCRALGMKVLQTDVSLTEVTTVLAVLIGEDADMTPEQIGDVLVEDGYGELLLPLGQFLVRAQRGNKEHEKEAARAKKAEREAARGGAPGPQSD